MKKYGNLLVPVYDPDVEIVNLQYINANGDKWFVAGGRAAGCFFTITDEVKDQERIIIAEGFATAATLHEAVRCETVVAFNAGNLTNVATLVRRDFNAMDDELWRARVKLDAGGGRVAERRQKQHDPEIIIAVDDDWKTADNPGFFKGLQAARAANAKIARPWFLLEAREDQETDFNDLAACFIEAGGTAEQWHEAIKEDIGLAVTPDEFLAWILQRDPHSAFGKG